MFKNNTVRLLMSIMVFSAALPATAKIEPIVTPNESIVYVVDQDREMTVFQSHAEPLKIGIKFDVAENLCAVNYQKPKCVYNVGYSLDHVSMLWTKHPDPLKIGKIAMAKYFYDSSDLTKYRRQELDRDFIGSTFANQFIGSGIDSRFQPDEIICDNYDWLGTDVVGLKQLQITSWHSEFMRRNSQTDSDENKTVLSAENIDFLFNNKLILQKISKVTTNQRGGSTVLLPSATMVTMHLQNNLKENCQISMAMNISAAAAGLDTSAPFKKNPNYQKLIYPNSIAFAQFSDQFSSIFGELYGNQKVEFE